MRRTPWSRIREQNSVYKEFLEIVGNGKPTGSVWKETTAVSATISISVDKWHSRTSPNSFMQQNGRNASLTRSPRGRSPSGRTSRWHCKDYLRRTCNNSFCVKRHPPERLFYKTKSGCRFGKNCSFAHRQVDDDFILFCCNWIVYSWRRSTVTDGVCKDNTSNDPFSRCEICNKLGYSLSGDDKTKSDYNIQKKRTLYLVLRVRGEMQLTYKTFLLNGETSDTNDNVKTKTNTKHMKPNNDVTHLVNTRMCS